MLSIGSPSEDARKVYTITEPPGTEMVPMHIRQDRRIAIPIWYTVISIPVDCAMKKMAVT